MESINEGKWKERERNERERVREMGGREGERTKKRQNYLQVTSIFGVNGEVVILVRIDFSIVDKFKLQRNKRSHDFKVVYHMTIMLLVNLLYCEPTVLG